METDDDSLNQEHIYEIGAWSKFLDKSIPKIFQSSINIEDYIKAHDNEDENSLIDSVKSVIYCDKFDEKITYFREKFAKILARWLYGARVRLLDFGDSL